MSQNKPAVRPAARYRQGAGELISHASMQVIQRVAEMSKILWRGAIHNASVQAVNVITKMFIRAEVALAISSSAGNNPSHCTTSKPKRMMTMRSECQRWAQALRNRYR